MMNPSEGSGTCNSSGDPSTASIAAFACWLCACALAAGGTSSSKIGEGYEGKTFAMDVQARALENGLVIMGFTGGSNLEGTKGNHNMLSPAYNVTKQEVETIVDIFAKSVEEVLVASGL